MLSPGQPYAPALAAALLVLLLAGFVLRTLRKDRKEYGHFKRYRDTARRQKMYRKWLIESFAMFGGASVLVLLLTGRYVPLLLAEIGAWPPVRWWHEMLAASGDLGTGLAVGAGLALLIGMVAILFLARGHDEVPAIGDITALLPRNRAELRWGAAMSLNAGVVEELLFRLALPTLIFATTGNALVAVIASIVIFGFLHLYQGVWGILGTMILGAGLMAIYLLSGSLLLAIAVHALFDLRSLVLIPIIVFRVHRERGNGRAPRAAAAVPATAPAPAAAPDAAASDSAPPPDIAAEPAPTPAAASAPSAATASASEPFSD